MVTVTTYTIFDRVSKTSILFFFLFLENSQSILFIMTKNLAQQIMPFTPFKTHRVISVSKK